MQLPPTILSLNKHEKKNKQAKPSENQRKDGSESKGASTMLSEPDESEAPSIDNSQEDATDSSSETSSDSESESIHGDVVIAEEATVHAADAPADAPENENPSESPKKRSSKRPGLRPPRTLETTLFDRLERMYGPGIKRLLNVQYRYAPTTSHSFLLFSPTLEDARSNLPVPIQDALCVQADIARLGILTSTLRFA